MAQSCLALGLHIRSVCVMPRIKLGVSISFVAKLFRDKLTSSTFAPVSSSSALSYCSKLFFYSDISRRWYL